MVTSTRLARLQVRHPPSGVASPGAPSCESPVSGRLPGSVPRLPSQWWVHAGYVESTRLRAVLFTRVGAECANGMLRACVGAL